MTKNTQKLVQLGMLIAISLIMAFTPIGYIKLGVLSLTLMTIPVIVGAIIQGVTGGAVIGAVFGLTSFAQAFTGDPLGAVAINISIPRLFIMCVLPRLLMGILTGLLFQYLNKGANTKNLSYEITGLAASLMNTIFFLGSLVILFGGEPQMQTTLGAAGAGQLRILQILLAGTAAQAAVEAIVCTFIASVAAKVIHTAFLNQQISGE
jgi:uncharacterized membrane protein